MTKEEILEKLQRDTIIRGLSRNIAVVATILPAIVPVCRERVPAMCASELIYGLPVYAVKMIVPPQRPAWVRAKLSRFVPGHCFYRLSALIAGDGIRHCIGTKTVSAAK